MAKKIILEPEDFKAIVKFVEEQNVSFIKIEDAREVRQAILRAKLVDTEIKDKAEVAE